MTDEEIVEKLKQSEESEKKALKYLYKKHSKDIERLILRYGGSKADSEDIFQDTLIIFYEQVVNGQYIHKAKISTYLHTIAKNKMLNVIRKSNKIEFLTDEEKIKSTFSDSDPMKALNTGDRKVVIEYIMNQLSPECMQIIKLSIYKQFQMEDISNIMGYKNEQIARNKKYKCLKGLKKIIKSSTHLSKILKDG